MYISKFQVSNFKSYRDSIEVEFKPGFNIITGQNNAGKTALLEALTLRFEPKPHRSVRTVPVPGAQPHNKSTVREIFELSGKELLHSLQSMGGTYFFPSPDPGNTQEAMNRHLDDLIRRPELRLDIRLARGNGDEWMSADPNFLGTYRIASAPGTSVPEIFPVTATVDGLFTTGGGQFSNPWQDVRIPLAQYLSNRIYRFKAERFNVGQCAFGDTAILAPDASNLPQVLNTLDSNPVRFHRLNSTVTQILPQVRQVSVRPIGPEVQILIWSHDSVTERSDLAVPLNECGSGIGQVLAMLYVVMTSDHPQTIIVDEPQSFLHPGAVRNLIEVLKQYPQHQYIFATHSPAVITASDPATFTMVRAVEGESVLEVMDPSDTKHLQSYLSEIGARLSDVFGADNILWVEGQTEEQCFPLLLRKVAHRSLMGTAIVGIRETSALQNRDKKKVFEMYRKLSQAKTLLPRAIGFVFDEECLIDQQKAELRRMDPGHVHFLPRRMYENYLLHPAAVACVMNGINGFRQAPVTEDEVRQFFHAKRDERELGEHRLSYFCKETATVPADWERRIDAARLLTDAFRDLSETCVSYEKTTHSVAITEWLIENQPGELQEIAAFVDQLLPAVK
jgi:predicted ATPase